MLRRRVLHITFGSGLQSIHFFVSPRTRMISTDGVENIPQREDPGFRNEQAGLPMRSRVMAKTVGGMDQRRLPDIEVESKTGLSASCPSPESDFGKAANDFRSLTNIVEALPFAIEDRFEIGHPATQRHSEPEFKGDLSRPQTIGEWWDEQDEW